MFIREQREDVNESVRREEEEEVTRWRRRGSSREDLSSFSYHQRGWQRSCHISSVSTFSCLSCAEEKERERSFFSSKTPSIEAMDSCASDSVAVIELCSDISLWNCPGPPRHGGQQRFRQSRSHNLRNSPLFCIWTAFTQMHLCPLQKALSTTHLYRRGKCGIGGQQRRGQLRRGERGSSSLITQMSHSPRRRNFPFSSLKLGWRRNIHSKETSVHCLFGANHCFIHWWSLSWSSVDSQRMSPQRCHLSSEILQSADYDENHFELYSNVYRIIFMSN